MQSICSTSAARTCRRILIWFRSHTKSFICVPAYFLQYYSNFHGDFCVISLISLISDCHRYEISLICILKCLCAILSPLSFIKRQILMHRGRVEYYNPLKRSNRKFAQLFFLFHSPSVVIFYLNPNPKFIPNSYLKLTQP